MRNPGIATIIILLAISIVNFSCRQSETANDLSATKKQELDSFLYQLQTRLHLPGIAVAIVHNDQTLYKTVGFQNYNTQSTLTDSTPFFMGNISELMTATAVMRLAQSGKINIEDQVVKHLPYFQTGGKRNPGIQIKHLLTHTSGVPHHDAVWDLPTFDVNALEGITRSISQQQPEFVPAGNKVKRSQYNYDILADLVEKASGMQFEDYVQQHVLNPLGMKNSAIYKSPIQDSVARPHHIQNWLTYSLTTTNAYPHNREHAGSIGFHASPRDLTQWLRMLLHDGNLDNQTFLDKKHHHALFDKHYKTAEHTYIGFGWEIHEKQGIDYFTKGHFIGGFSADITLVPDQHIGVIVMSNVAEEFDPAVITDQIIQWLRGGKLNTPKIPVNIALGELLNANISLDSTLQAYHQLKQQQSDEYDYSHAALSKLGVNLLHRLNRKDDAIKVFDFILKQHPSSPYAHLNLAEAYVVNKNIPEAENQLKIIKELSDSPEPTVTAHMTSLEEAINIMKEKKPDLKPDDYYSN